MSQQKQEWTDEEVQTLVRLLEKVKADGGWWPTEECMNLAHGSISAWAPELVIFKHWWMRWRMFRRWRKVLLTVYEGGIKEFRGRWHIPGGYGTHRDISFQSTCSRVAIAELKIDIRFIRVFPRPYLWLPGNPGKPEHTYGRPLSIYTLVRPKGVIQETDTRRFFGRQELPDDLLPVHRKFIDQFIFP